MRRSAILSLILALIGLLHLPALGAESPPTARQDTPAPAAKDGRAGDVYQNDPQQDEPSPEAKGGQAGDVYQDDQHQDPPTPEAKALEEKWGVRVVAIRLTAYNHLIDFRYRVVDPRKALPLFDRNKKPELIDQATGARFFVPSPPKIGALRTTKNPEAGRNYFFLFGNPGQYLKKGNKVAVVVGDFKVENLTVE